VPRTTNREPRNALSSDAPSHEPERNAAAPKPGGITEAFGSLSLFSAVRPIQSATFVKDVLAGLELSATALPQALGYTKIAGMPVVTGLYALLVAPLAFATFGSSKYLVVAADSATAAIVAAGLTDFAPIGSSKYVALAGLVAVLTAGMLILARILKLGFLADFLSQTMLVGFLTGVGGQVAIAVMGEMLGIPTQPGGTLAKIAEIVEGLPRLNHLTLIFSATVLVGSFILGKYAPRFPTPLAAIVFSTAASAIWHFSDQGLSTIGSVAGGLPKFNWPAVSWSDLEPTIPIAASCFLMVLTQSAATARVYALRHQQEINENSDLVGLSAANAAAAISGAFVVNGSPTQTAMVESAGGNSQIAPMTTAIVVAFVLLFLTGPLQYLPNCVLGSLIFVVAFRLIDIRGLQAIRSESPGEFLLAIVTTIIVLFIGVEEGIISAMVMSLLRIIRHSYHPTTAVLVEGGSDEWTPAVPGASTAPGLIVYRFGAALFYANASYFAHQLRMLVASAPAATAWVIVEAGAITHMDYTAARVVRELIDNLAQRGVTFVLANVQTDLKADLDRHHLSGVIGASHLFENLQEALATIARRQSH
jgi:sulfate permease, SulP family